MFCGGLIDLSDVSSLLYSTELLSAVCVNRLGWGCLRPDLWTHFAYRLSEVIYGVFEGKRRVGLWNWQYSTVQEFIRSLFIVWSLFQTLSASFIPFFLRTTRSSKVFLWTRVNLPAHCVDSLPTVFFHAALGGAQRLVLGTHPLTRAYVCLLGRWKTFRRDYAFFQ